jgi:hypothetical protein
MGPNTFRLRPAKETKVARTRKSKAQAEIPGTESPDRIEEIHALGLEIKSLEQERMDLTKKEKEKRRQATAELHAHKLTEYDVDGVHVWIESKGEKLKVKLDGGPEDGE